MEILTNNKIRRFQYTGKTLCVLWDADTVGLGVRAYPSGRKVWVLRYVDAGRLRIRKLANIHALDLMTARAKAREILQTYEVRTALVAEHERTQNFEELAAYWLEHYAKQHRRTWEQDSRRLQVRILPKIGKMPIELIKPLHLVALHSEISSKAPVEANRCIQLVRTIYNQAIAWDVYEGKNPAKHLKLNREQRRDRWVKPEEMERLKTSIEQEKNPYVKWAVYLYLLTGLRRGEVLGMRWQDVDFERGILTVSRTKTDIVYRVRLSPAALSVLAEVPRGDSGWVLRGLYVDNPLTNINRSWRRIRKRAGLEDVRLHDLRHTFASWLLMSGASLSVVQRALNHKSIQSTQRYAHLSDSMLFDAVDNVGDKIQHLINSG